MSELKEIVEYYRNRAKNEIHDKYVSDLKNDLIKLQAVNTRLTEENAGLQKKKDAYESKYLEVQAELNAITTHVAYLVELGKITPNFARELLRAKPVIRSNEVLSGKLPLDDVTC